MNTLRFHKYEGIGNDFVLVEVDTADAFDAARASQV
jgi:diaminopimelate epimerase